MKIALKYIGLSLLAIVILTLIFLGSIATNVINNNGKSIIGRKISIDEIHLNYLKGSVEINNLKVFEEDNENEFTSLKRFYVNLSPYKLINNKLVIEEVHFDSLNINIKRTDSASFNFDDIIVFFKKDSLPEQSEKDSKPLHFKISDIKLDDINIVFNDQYINDKTEINDLSIAVPYIGWDQKKNTDADFKFVLNNGGEISSTINMNPISGDFQTKLEISNLHLGDLKKYLQKNININDLKGRLYTEIEAKGNFNVLSSINLQGYLTLNDLHISDAKDNRLTDVKKIHITVDNYSIGNNDLKINQIEIDNPKAVVSIIDKTVNWSTIFPKSTKKTKPQKTTSKKKQGRNFSYSVNQIKISNGEVDYVDNIFGKLFRYELDKINIHSNNVSSQNPWISTSSNIELNKSGSLASQFNINISTGEYKLESKLNKLQVADFNSTVKSFLNISSLKGSINSSIKLRGNYNINNDIEISGILDANNLKLQKNNTTVISVDSLSTNIDKISLKDNQFIFNDISIFKPYFNFEIQTGKTNFSNLVIKKEETTQKADKLQKQVDTPKTKNSELIYTVKSIQVKAGKIDYKDNLTGDEFIYQADRIYLNSKNIHTTSNWITIDFNTRLNKRGKLKGQTSFNPNDFNTSTLKFSMENVDLTDFNQYSNHYVGHVFDKGYLYYYSETDIKKGKLKSSNDFIIRSNEIQPTGEGLYDVPLKVAFYLSTNSDNNVDIKVPIEGDLNNPNINATTLITKTFTNIIFKIVSSPTNIVSNIVVGKKDAVDEIPLFTNQIDLDKKQEKLLDKIVKLEQKDKNLIIELIYKTNDSTQKQSNTEVIITKAMDYLQEKNKTTEIFILQSKDSIVSDSKKENKPRFIINYYSKK